MPSFKGLADEGGEGVAEYHYEVYISPEQAKANRKKKMKRLAIGGFFLVSAITATAVGLAFYLNQTSACDQQAALATGCEAELFYPQFECYVEDGLVTEWAFFRQADASADRAFFPKELAFGDAAVSSEVYEEFFSPATDDRIIVGNYVYNAKYNLGALLGYMYVFLGYKHTEASRITSSTDPIDVGLLGPYFCFWMKVNKLGPPFTLELISSDTEQSEVQFSPSTTEWENICVDITDFSKKGNVANAVRMDSVVNIVLLQINSEEDRFEDVHLQITQFYFSKERTTLGGIPALADLSQSVTFENETCKVAEAIMPPIPSDCSNYYPEFLENLTLAQPMNLTLGTSSELQVTDSEWAFLRIEDVNVSAELTLASVESDSGRDIIFQNLSYFAQPEDGIETAGNLIARMRYSLDRLSSMSIPNTFHWFDVYGAGTPVNVIDFGDYFCLWLKSSAENQLYTLSFHSGIDSVSYIDFTVESTSWEHKCVALSLLKTESLGTAVDLSELTRVLLHHDGTKSADIGFDIIEYELQYTMMYFSQQNLILPILPAVSDPAAILEPTRTVDGCEYLPAFLASLDT